MSLESASVQSPASDVSDKAVLDATDYLRQRLRRNLVDRWDASGDFVTALFDHLRGRQAPRLFFDPRELPKRAKLIAERDPKAHAQERQIADEARQGRWKTATDFIAVDRDTFDFSQLDHPDPQTIYMFNRLGWFVALARQYWLDGDRTYFDTLMADWDYFDRVVPDPDDAIYGQTHLIGDRNFTCPYHHLDVYVRLTNLWWAYWLMLFADPMTPQRNAVLLARCLRAFDMVASRAIHTLEKNFTAMRVEAVYLWAQSLPEANGMVEQKHHARQLAEASLALGVFPDGVQCEASPSYHTGCIRWYAAPYLLGRLNNEPWADAYGRRLVDMGRHLDAIITLDGHVPPISDSSRDEAWRDAMALLETMFPDEPFMHRAGDTHLGLWLTGQSPAVREQRPISDYANVFPNGGVGVMRNDNALLLMQNGPRKFGHSHHDSLSIYYEAFGRIVLTDGGKWRYDNADPDRAWTQSIWSHNTIAITDDDPLTRDKQSRHLGTQVMQGPADPRYGVMRQSRQDSLMLLDATFAGYEDDVEARVRRIVAMPVDPTTPWLVVIDQIHAPRPHLWTNAWLLPTDRPVTVRESGFDAQLDDDLRVAMRYADSTLAIRDEPRFWCPTTGRKRPARWVRMSATVNVSAVRAFLCRPTRGGVAEGDHISLKPGHVEVTVDGTLHTIHDT